MIKKRKMYLNIILFLNFVAVITPLDPFVCDEDPETNSDQVVCLPKEYNRFKPPLLRGRTQVGVTFHVDEIFSVQDNVVKLSCYFNHEWMDTRIRRRVGFGSEQRRPGANQRNNPPIFVPQPIEFFDHLWKPNLFIYNLKEMDVMKVNGNLEGLWLSNQGKVLHSRAVIMSIYCPMDYTSFPFDAHVCLIRVGSYSRSDKDMIFVDSSKFFDIKAWKSKISHEFSIKLDHLREEDKTFNGGALGNFSLTGLQVSMKRKAGPYITGYYIPSGFVVLLSWISFFIPIYKMAARIGLLSIAMLILVTLGLNVLSSTPKADHLNSIEVWMLVCVSFIFATFVQYGVLLWKRQNKFAKTITVDKLEYQATRNGGSNHETDIDDEFRRYDKSYLVLFLVLFLVFNLAYWLGYLI